MRPNGGSTTDATTASAASATRVDPAFVAEAGRGCHIALDATATSWHLGCEAVDPDEYSDDAVFPDVAIDFDQGARSSSARLSVTNVGDDECVKVAYVTVYETKCVGRNGQELEQGVTIDNGGGRSNVTTFIALVPPNASLHLCRLKLKKGEDVRSVRIDNDVRPWSMHPEPNDTHARSVGFPLRGERFLCTQSEGGELTHFFSGNLHAVDFRCDVGTPVLAVGDGEVVEVNDSNTLTGIAVGNLFKWNSIVLKLDEEDSSSARAAGATSSTAGGAEESSIAGRYEVKGGDLYVEYVHVAHRSSRVKVGDRVTRGQVICSSGSVGFSPEPHLHFTAFRSSEAMANTVRVLFEPAYDRSGSAKYVPRAGEYYNENGPVVAASASK